MDDVQNKQADGLAPDSEELKFEEEALQETDSDKLREQLAENLGLDPDEHSEILDKAVAREVEQRKTLGKAIEQKRKWREEATKGKEPEAPKPEAAPQPTQPQDVGDAVRKALDEERLADMDLPDEVKAEVRKLAEIKGGVREALKDPYIQYLKEQAEQAARVDAGGGTQHPRSVPSAKVDTSKPLNPDDFDLTTEEGRKAWDEAKKARKKAQE